MDNNTYKLYAIIAVGLMAIAMGGMVGITWLLYKVDLDPAIIGYLSPVPVSAISVVGGFIGGAGAANYANHREKAQNDKP